MLYVNQISTYYGSACALEDVSFEVRQGEIVSIIGANGAGKSTLMKSIMQVVSPRSGTIRYKDKDITHMPTHRIVGEGIVYVPEGRDVFATMSVQDNLIMGAYSRRFASKELEELCEEMYKMFPRLKERRKQLAGTLSGGEQQMLAIARGLMSRPEIIMFDEPSLGLAPIIVKEIFEAIKEINKEGTTILFVEQNSKIALSTADRGYVMQTGEMILTDTCKNLMANEEVKKAYLGGE